MARTSGFSAILRYGRLKQTLARYIMLKEACEGCQILDQLDSSNICSIDEWVGFLGIWDIEP
jgi:hypothetical protein